jgi:hypothetical protein
LKALCSDRHRAYIFKSQFCIAVYIVTDQAHDEFVFFNDVLGGIQTTDTSARTTSLTSRSRRSPNVQQPQVVTLPVAVVVLMTVNIMVLFFSSAYTRS